MSPNTLEAVDLCVEGSRMEMERDGRSVEEYSLWRAR
jgi:hypothetical protein